MLNRPLRRIRQLVATQRKLPIRLMSTSNQARVKFAAIQLAVGADKQANLQNARQQIAQAAHNGAKIVALPECFNCPYGTKYFPEYAEEIATGPTPKMLSEAAKESGVWLVGGSFPERDGGKLYNTSLSFAPDGQMVAKHRKVHLFDIDIPGKMTFKESDSLSPGSAVTTFDTPYFKIGVAICYDIRFAELSMLMRREGCKFLCFPGAFNMTTGPLHWELLQRARAVDNQCFVAGVSPARDTTADYIAWGHSSIVSPWGEVIAKADEKASIIYGDIDPAQADEMRASIPTSVQRRADMYELVDKSK